MRSGPRPGYRGASTRVQVLERELPLLPIAPGSACRRVVLDPARGPEGAGVTEDAVKILIADDNRLMLEGFRRALEPVRGHRDRRGDALRVREVLALVERRRPDVVALELGLRTRDGRSCLEALGAGASRTSRWSFSRPARRRRSSARRWARGRGRSSPRTSTRSTSRRRSGRPTTGASTTSSRQPPGPTTRCAMPASRRVRSRCSSRSRAGSPTRRSARSCGSPSRP